MSGSRAGLQVHFARLAERLDARRAVLHRATAPARPAAAPPASYVRWSTGPRRERSRFCLCSLCGTLWNSVRVKCIACASTKGIGYQAIEGGLRTTIKAECCDECRGLREDPSEDEDRALEGIADDVASLGARSAGARGGLSPRRR